VEAELELLQGENTSQSEKVKTFTDRIADTLTKQWEGMTNLLKTETTSIVEAAHKEFKEVNDQLVQLHEWTKKKIEQETQDRINSDTTLQEAGEAALKTITSLKRKLRDPEDPLGTASTKWQRPDPNMLRTLTRTLGGDLVLRARVVPGIGTSVGSEEGLRVA